MSIDAVQQKQIVLLVKTMSISFTEPNRKLGKHIDTADTGQVVKDDLSADQSKQR